MKWQTPPMREYHKDGWKIYVGETRIGIAYCRTLDFPWYICDFEPTPEFENYRHTFDEYAAIVNFPQEHRGIDFAEYYETNIQSLNLKLIPFGDLGEGQVFVTQIYDGVEAWLRPL